MTNDKFRIHLIPGNGMRRNQQDSGSPRDPKQHLKYAMFYLVIAAILLVTNQTAKNPMADENQSRSPSDLNIDLSVARKLEPNDRGSVHPVGAAYVFRFRLTNQGKQPIFYPVFPNTNRPIGHLVYRIPPQSDWKLLFEPELSQSGPAQVNADGHIVWVEMPPGGWADGQYDDPGFPAGEHAYELDLKFAADGKVWPVLSHPYLARPN